MKALLRRFSALICILALCLASANALTVEEALGLLEDYYVDPLPAAAYEAETLDDLFLTLGDPHTYYMTPSDYEEFNKTVEREDSVTGIGAGIEYTADGIHLTAILSGGGAEAAGLVPGDYIVSVDGISCVPASDQHRALIIGEEGTLVTLAIRHQDGTIEDYQIQRTVVPVHNTSVTYADGIGYIDCDSFGSKTDTYFANGLNAYPDTELWRIDLRNNTGGYADAAVNILGYYLGSGPKLYYRNGAGSSFFSLTIDDALTDKPAIVLVNGWSASASEILAGGLSAGKDGVVIGSRTYGKGTAQIVLDKSSYPHLFDEDSLKVTAYRFYGPTGNTTDKIGVLPTLLIPDAYTADVASLLRVNRPEKEEYLAVELNGLVFYIDPSAAEEDGKEEALHLLLSALAPDVGVNRISGPETTMISAAEALNRYGDTALSRCFTDVDDSPYADEINTLGTYGILLGDGEGHFNPERTLTRAELCRLLAQALNVTSHGMSLFSDVPEDAWYSGEVNAIARLGLMNGIGDGLFAPESPLTQEQFITVMGRLSAFLNLEASSIFELLKDLDSFEELSAFSDWAKPGAAVLSDLSATYSVDSNLLFLGDLEEIDPQASVTRDQAAASICHMLKMLDILSY